MKRIIITGCATGFGATLAQSCLERGDHVVATDRDRTALSHLDAFQDSGRLERHALDVRQEHDVQRVCEEITSAGPVDVLVNNAGHAVFGTIEETPLDLVQDMFDVNVMGLARVTQALLPALRRASGLVVNVSSVAGRMAFPESGYYAATKHAVEAISDALYAEAARYGVRVAIIEPGSFDTQFLPTASRLSPPRDPNGPYAPHQAQWDAVKQAVLEPPQDRDLVVRAMLDAIDGDLRLQRIPVGPDCVRLLDAVDRLGPSGFSRLLAHHSSGAPSWEQAGDAEDAHVELERILRIDKDG